MKFVMNNLKVIIAFIIGVILAGGIVYAATSARDVSYTTSKNGEIKNVEEALNDLYHKKNNSNISVLHDAAGIEGGNLSKTWTVEEACTYVISIHSGRGNNNGGHAHSVKKNNVNVQHTTESWFSDWSWGETFIVPAEVGDTMYVYANTSNSYGDEYISVTEIK